MTRRRRPDPRLPSFEERAWRRRDVLKLGATAAGVVVLPLLACAPGELPQGHVNSDVDPDAYDGGEEVALDPQGVPHDDVLFPLAVGAGAARPTSVLLKAYASDGAAKRLRVWRPGRAEGHVVLVFDDVVTPSDGGWMSVTVEELAPATSYEYALFDDDDSARSLVGRFRTAFPEDWQMTVRVGAMTCTNWDHQPWVAGERIAEEPLEMLVHLGDMAYNDGAVSLDDYRVKWRAALGDPGYRAALGSASLYMSWDDHEFTNNLNPEQMDPTQLAAAKDAFFEALPVERGPDGQLWQSHRWGQTLEVIALDCRTERRPSSRASDAAAYLGDEQQAWLKQTLKDSPCQFKLILNSVPMTLLPELWALTGDRWQGYAEAREDLLSFIDDEGIEGVWFLSGDFHLGFVARLEPDGPRRRMWEIAAGPSGNLGNPLAFLAESEEYREEAFPSSQFAYGKGRIAATFLTFNPVHDSVRVRFLDGETGEVLYDEWLRQGD